MFATFALPAVAARVTRCALALCVSIGVLSACSSLSPEPVWKRAVAGDGPGNPELINAGPIKVSNLPKSRSGNRPVYEVFGVRYEVLDSAQGFKEQGLASWYGKKFHGRATSSGEIYDMHQMTAAHKHLPLPTFVRVTRNDNGKSIIVKVNDRGPFVENRIIDLSYAAAVKLGIHESGKAAVTVEALSTHHAESATVADAVNGFDSTPAQGYFLQTGAFSSEPNAYHLKRQVSHRIDADVSVNYDAARKLYLVQVGPLAGSETMLSTKAQLVRYGIQAHRVSPR